jgi:hypothetical protein
VAGDELADVMRAVALAREAMEEDARAARSRGWGSPSPDTASVGMLAAGILIANAIQGASEAKKHVVVPRTRAARASRSAA